MDKGCIVSVAGKYISVKKQFYKTRFFILHT
jgi:hypothetical protein